MDSRPQAAMKYEVGKAISFQLADGRSLRGFVHAEDRLARIICLEVIPSAEVAILPTANIKSGSVVTENIPNRKWPSNSNTDIAAIKAEEARVLAKQEEEFNLLGVGVSASAQAIFDTLNKTLPCKWVRDEIVILDSVRLSPPYDVKSISGDGDAGVVDRVKMILQRESPSSKSANGANGLKP